MNMTKWIWLLAGVLFVALGGVAAYKVWPLLNPQVAVQAPLDPDCDLRAGPCISILPGGGRVSFGIRPLSIPVVEPLELEIRVEGVDAASAEVDFSGVDMNMGFNRPKLESRGGGVFSGDGMLPVCVRDAMEWEAKVLLRTPDGLVAAPYRFITVKPGVEIPGGGR
jgi:hypothetical protein